MPRSDPTLVAPMVPADVQGVLARYLLADGYDIVMDCERSHDSWAYASRARRELAALRTLETEFGGLVTNCRGLGLMIAFDLPSPEIRAHAHERIIEQGLLCPTCGPRSIRYRPPLNPSRTEADEVVERTRYALRGI